MEERSPSVGRGRGRGRHLSTSTTKSDSSVSNPPSSPSVLGKICLFVLCKTCIYFLQEVLKSCQAVLFPGEEEYSGRGWPEERRLQDEALAEDAEEESSSLHRISVHQVPRQASRCLQIVVDPEKKLSRRDSSPWILTKKHQSSPWQLPSVQVTIPTLTSLSPR